MITVVKFLLIVVVAEGAVNDETKIFALRCLTDEEPTRGRKTGFEFTSPAK